MRLIPQTLVVDGKRFVILPEEEYARLASQDDSLPPFPRPDADGNYPAVEALTAGLARSLIRRRRALGWSQAELARRAGVRLETVNRLELGKHVLTLPTVSKIERALERGETS